MTNPITIKYDRWIMCNVAKLSKTSSQPNLHDNLESQDSGSLVLTKTWLATTSTILPSLASSALSEGSMRTQLLQVNSLSLMI